MQERQKIDVSIANKIYDILINVGGANEHWRIEFIAWAKSGIGHEFRFGGILGRGGKLWIHHANEPLIFSVRSYPEDMTEERKQIQNDMMVAIDKVVIP